MVGGQAARFRATFLLALVPYGDSAQAMAAAAAYPQDTLLPSFDRLVQLDRHSCAAQSVAIVLRYYRDEVPYADLLRELGTTEDGTSTRKVVVFFSRRGYRVRSFAGWSLVHPAAVVASRLRSRERRSRRRGAGPAMSMLRLRAGVEIFYLMEPVPPLA